MQQAPAPVGGPAAAPGGGRSRVRAMHGYVFDDATPEEVEAERATYAPIADVLRELTEASLLTTVAPEVAAEAVAKLREAHELLSSRTEGESYRVRYSSHGLTRAWGNTVVGIRNPMAPPVEMNREEDGRVWSDFRLGPQYEGPPTLVHGGVTALILDQFLGEAAAASGSPGMTGTLTIRYRRGTPLGELHGEARTTRVDGVKTFVSGTISDAEGVCVEAEGVFIQPKWAREAIAANKPQQYE